VASRSAPVGRAILDAMLTTPFGTARELGRLQEIAGVLMRHGQGDAVHRPGRGGHRRPDDDEG